MSTDTQKKKESIAAKDEEKDAGAVAWKQRKSPKRAIIPAVEVAQELESAEAKKRRKGIKLALAAAVQAQAALAALPQHCL